MRAYPISEYKTNIVEGAATILMIMNNLDRRVAQFPEELVTYGGNGQVSALNSVYTSQCCSYFVMKLCFITIHTSALNVPLNNYL